MATLRRPRCAGVCENHWESQLRTFGGTLIGCQLGSCPVASLELVCVAQTAESRPFHSIDRTLHAVFLVPRSLVNNSLSPIAIEQHGDPLLLLSPRSHFVWSRMCDNTDLS